MQAAPERPDESAALAALRDLAILDTAPEAEFDALVRVASIVCAAPIALVSLIDARRQWFKAQVGLGGIRETPRELAFCAHTVLGQDVFEIPDAADDARFADNPLVTGHPHIRHYAGAPIQLSDGLRVGTLCVIKPTPGRLDAAQRQALVSLAVAAARALEGRHATRIALQGAMASALIPPGPAAAAAHVRQVLADFGRQHDVLHAALGQISDAVIATDGTGRVTWLNAAAERLSGWPVADACGTPLGQVFQLAEPFDDPARPAAIERSAARAGRPAARPRGAGRPRRRGAADRVRRAVGR